MGYEIIRYRHNIMTVNSLTAFASLKGGFNQNCRDVYFVRALGANKELLADIEKMDHTLGDNMLAGKLLYIRMEGLPRLSLPEDTAYYAACYAKWLDSNKSRMETKASVVDEKLVMTLSEACKQVLEKYEFGKAAISESIKKNFIVKLLYWFDAAMKDFLKSWDERSSIKIAANNVVKEQEYLFFYLLTLVGADVLLIQNKMDVTCGPRLKELSKELPLGDYVEYDIPVYSERERKAVVKETGESIRLQLPERHRKKQQETKQPDTQQLEIKQPHTQKPDTKQEREKSFEELALLASSIVMIAVHGGNGEVIGTGSGIMVGKNGYILTNNHVASGGRFYSVRIEDDEEVYRTDEVIKYHSVLDLAILRIDRILHPLPIYKGKQRLVRGQKVVAIGSPLGLFNSVSDGIISGFRTIDKVDMIQFTAPTSHGSSGGAVLNMYGEVIGISTAGIDSGQNINLAMGYESINMFIKGFE